MANQKIAMASTLETKNINSLINSIFFDILTQRKKIEYKTLKMNKLQSCQKKRHNKNSVTRVTPLSSKSDAADNQSLAFLRVKSQKNRVTYLTWCVSMCCTCCVKMSHVLHKSIPYNFFCKFLNDIYS